MGVEPDGVTQSARVAVYEGRVGGKERVPGCIAVCGCGLSQGVGAPVAAAAVDDGAAPAVISHGLAGDGRPASVSTHDENPKALVRPRCCLLRVADRRAQTSTCALAVSLCLTRLANSIAVREPALRAWSEWCGGG